MTGTGTQTDPLIPANWDEFITAITTSGAYVSMPENGMWDMNEILPGGLKTNIYVTCTQIDGNGFTLRNLYILGGGYFTAYCSRTTWNNFNFINFYASNTTYPLFITSSNPYRFTFNGCKFSGVLDNADLFYRAVNHTYCIISSCSFNLQFIGESRFAATSFDSSNIGNIQPIHCKIKLSGTSSIAQEFSLNNSYLTGDNPFPTLYIDDSSAYPATNSVIDCNISAGQVFGAISGTYITNVLVNSDKVDSSVDIPEQLTAVTTAQLGNAEYLSSTGFPIGVDS